jgi:DDE_Tnp_1-associated
MRKRESTANPKLELLDPRRQHPTTLHPLEAILTMTILAPICGAQNWVESEPWGHAHHA